MKLSYEQAKLDFTKEKTREELEEKLGKECVNCGSNVDIEYHHIVPLALGGTNRITNIVPLCYVCHKIAHGAGNIRKLCKSDNTGRPKNIPPDNYEDILLDYVYGEIGRKECARLLNLGKTGRIKEQWYYTEFLQKHKILDVKNKVDLNNCNKNKDSLKKNRPTSIITYIDGKEEIIYS